ncbi:MAG: type secretion system family protein, partial [Conexibacter sp.]|nr:type secretion system family protein [Conexibacter sp.]
MSTYVFKAMDLTGAKASGEVEAESKQIVSDQLKQRGLIVLEIADKHTSKELEIPFFNRIKSADLTIMTRQLATMVNSGMTILRALYVLEAQTENDKLVAAISLVRKDVEAGLPLSDALERHPKVFNQLFVAMTRAGETGGVLDSALLRVADQLESADSLRRQVKAAMAYPIVVMVFAFSVLIALVVFLVPVFVGTFKQFGGDLPTITKFTVGLSNAITGYWYAFIVGGFATSWSFKKWKASEPGRKMWDTFKLRIPMKIGDIVQKIALARWSRTLSALVSAGVPLMSALEITGQTAGN